MADPQRPETIFTYGAPQLKFGAGASAEIDHDLRWYGVRRVLVVTDPGVVVTGSPAAVAEQIEAYTIEAEVYADSHIEPTDLSGNAGVHIPHANAYPIAGQVREFRPDGYPGDEPMVPHGMAVSLTAPAAFRFTFDAAPERHVRAAQLLAPGAGRPADAATYLPGVLTALMRDVGTPAGFGAVGYGQGDVDRLVEGGLKQQRLLSIAPREVTGDDLAAILRTSIELW